MYKKTKMQIQNEYKDNIRFSKEFQIRIKTLCFYDLVRMVFLIFYEAMKAEIFWRFGIPVGGKWVKNEHINFAKQRNWLYYVTQTFTATFVESYTIMNTSDKKQTVLIHFFYEWKSKGQNFKKRWKERPGSFNIYSHQNHKLVHINIMGNIIVYAIN